MCAVNFQLASTSLYTVYFFFCCQSGLKKSLGMSVVFVILGDIRMEIFSRRIIIQEEF